MAKTRVEQIANIDDEITRLENRRKELVQQHKAQERKERTKRLCRRMGLFESLVPESIPLTEEQFRSFLESTVASPYGLRLLADLTAQAAVTPAEPGDDSVEDAGDAGDTEKDDEQG